MLGVRKRREKKKGQRTREIKRYRQSPCVWERERRRQRETCR